MMESTSIGLNGCVETYKALHGHTRLLIADTHPADHLRFRIAKLLAATYMVFLLAIS